MSINSKLNTRIIAGFITLIVCAFLLLNVANGQEAEEWTQPLNLSQSGSASNPTLVKDASGLLYAFWQNSVDGYIVSTNLNNDWSTPRVAETPFGTKAFEVNATETSRIPLYEPILVADKELGLHTFWINDDTQLSYSRIITGEISTLSTWSNPQLIGNNVATVAAVSDTSNRIHIAYLSTGNGGSQLPGIYHRISNDQGQSWSEEAFVYSSSYFRQATAGLVQLNFISLDNNATLLTWNDSFTEQVFVAEFATDSWDAPQIIDSRQEGDNPESSGPANINGGISADGVHLFWTAGHDGGNCSLYTRISVNDGAEWSVPERLSADNAGCPSYFRILSSDDLFLLFTMRAGKAEFRIWADGVWSDPFSQPQLVEFSDPVSFRNVAADCPYEFEFHDDKLIAVGCGTGTVADIWASERSEDNLLNSLTFESVWSPQSVFTNPSLGNIQDLQFLSEGENIHAIWSAEDLGPAFESQASGERKVYYSFWNGEEWIEPASVLSATESPIQSVSSTITKDGNILVVWDDVEGSLYFSKAKADQASFFSAWSMPEPLPLEIKGARYPQIVSSNDGSAYVTYAIPFNENRGIYMIQGEDDGDTWAPFPTFVLDAADLAVIGKPKLAISPEGIFNLTALHWPQPTVNDQIAEIYFLRSTDSGRTWTEQVVLEKELQNRNIEAVWADIQADDAKNTHLTWQEIQNGELELWHQRSGDRGNNWSKSIRLSTIGQPIGYPSLVIDSSNTPHLLQLVVQQSTNNNERYLLQHWSYINNRWIADEVLKMQPDVNQENALSAAVTNDNRLLVGTNVQAQIEESYASGIFYVNQQLVLLEENSIPNVEIAPTLEPEVDVPVNEVVENEEILAEEHLIDVTAPDTNTGTTLFGNLGNFLGSLILALIVVAPIMIVVITVRVVRSRIQGW